MISPRSCSITLCLLCFHVFYTVAQAHTDFEFGKVLYHTCYDGDTCMVSLPDVHPLFGDHILLRIDGIDAPEIKGNCDQEKSLAREARNFLRSVMGRANTIRLTKAHRGKYFRIVATVLADGADVGELMVSKGYAVRYDGGTRRANWCGDHKETPIAEPPVANAPTNLPDEAESPSSAQ